MGLQHGPDPVSGMDGDKQVSAASISGRERAARHTAAAQADPHWHDKRKAALKLADAYDKAWRAAGCPLVFQRKVDWIKARMPA
jgi:hypothetical protein